MRCIHLAAALALAASGCVKVQGSGTATTQVRDMGPFSSVSFGDGFAGTLVVGEDGPILLSGDDNVLPLFQTELRNGRLTIRLQDPSTLVEPRTELRVNLRAARLEEIEISGGASLRGAGEAHDVRVAFADGALGALSGLRMTGAEVELSGGADVALSVDGELRGSVSGGSRLSVAGAVTARNLRVSSDSALELE
jgi:hypothetical protein